MFSAAQNIASQRAASAPLRAAWAVGQRLWKRADVPGSLEALEAGRIPIYEPGLEDMVTRNVREQRLSFTTDTDAAVKNALVVFIAVGTPPRDDGSTDLSYVETVAREVGRADCPETPTPGERRELRRGVDRDLSRGDLRGARLPVERQ